MYFVVYTLCLRISYSLIFYHENLNQYKNNHHEYFIELSKVDMKLYNNNKEIVSENGKIYFTSSNINSIDTS